MNPQNDTIILEPEETARAAEILRSGGLVVFPTETVYGLGADALNSRACARIFQAKDRPADNPLIVHIADLDDLPRICANPPELALALFRRFSPGPFTVVLPASHLIPGIVTAGLDTVAVRIPSDPVARAIIRASGCPVAAPSANRSGRPSPTDFESAREHMEGRVDAIVRGAPCRVGLESTIIRVSSDGGTTRVEVLREGAVTVELIAAELPNGTPLLTPGKRDTVPGGADSVLDADISDPVVTLAPGTRHRHYQPAAEVRLFEAGQGDESLRSIISRRVVMLLLDEPLPLVVPADAMRVLRFESLEHYARELYRCFRQCDLDGYELIVAELPPNEGLGRALRDRLFRASG